MLGHIVTEMLFESTHDILRGGEMKPVQCLWLPQFRNLLIVIKPTELEIKQDYKLSGSAIVGPQIDLPDIVVDQALRTIKEQEILNSLAADLNNWLYRQQQLSK